MLPGPSVLRAQPFGPAFLCSPAHGAALEGGAEGTPPHLSPMKTDTRVETPHGYVGWGWQRDLDREDGSTWVAPTW